MKKRRISRRELIDTNYGRKCGWYVEFEGQKVARLTDPQWEDMFWVSYRVELLTRDPALQSQFSSVDFWDTGNVVYRNCEFDEETVDALEGGNTSTVLKTGRIVMRFLYLSPPQRWWEHLLSWLMSPG